MASLGGQFLSPPTGFGANTGSTDRSSYTYNNTAAMKDAGVVPMQGTGLKPTPEYAQPANAVGGFQTMGFQYGAAPSEMLNTDQIAAAQMPVSQVGQQPLYMQNMQDAYMNQATSRLDPQWTSRQSDMETQLANMGISRGSPAWDREMANFQRGRNDAYGSAMNSAILNSGAEAQRAQGMDIAGGNFANQAAQQNFQNQLASQGAANAARGQQFGQNLSSAQLNNAALSAQQAAGQGWKQIEAQRHAADQAYAGQAAIAGAQTAAAQMQAALGQRQMESAERLQDYNMMWDMQFKPYELQNLAMQGMYPTAAPSFGGFQNMGVDPNYAANLNRGNDQMTNAVGNVGASINWRGLGGMDYGNLDPYGMQMGGR